MIVIIKVITRRTIILNKEGTGNPTYIHSRIISDNFEIINMGTDMIISVPSGRLCHPDIPVVPGRDKAYDTKEVCKSLSKNGSASSQTV